jgi:hypothetical protein
MPASTLFVIALVSLCYLIGLTYIAKQEALNRLGAMWPLLLLVVPVVYDLLILPEKGVLAFMAAGALATLILISLYFLKRRAKGDVSRAVMSLIAGISLVDAIYLAGAGNRVAVTAALICFAATLALQRWVKGT